MNCIIQSTQKFEHIYKVLVSRKEQTNAKKEAYSLILKQELEKLLKQEEVHHEKIKLQIEKNAK